MHFLTQNKANKNPALYDIYEHRFWCESIICHLKQQMDHERIP